MSDQIAHTPLAGPTTYDFGESTPKGWPQGEYVPKAIYDVLVERVKAAERHIWRFGGGTNHAYIAQLEAALRNVCQASFCGREFEKIEFGPGCWKDAQAALSGSTPETK